MNHFIVHERLDEIRKNLGILEELRQHSVQEFIQDPKIHKLAERCLQLCIECVLDIAHYLISQNNWSRPADNTDAVIELGDHGVLPRDFAEAIAGMINFRNILVHAYLKIDRAIVFDHLNRLDNFRDFEKFLLEYLRKC